VPFRTHRIILLAMGELSFLLQWRVITCIIKRLATLEKVLLFVAV
jgi:hypothetical protein